MMISSFYTFLNYFFSLALFFNYNSPILFWVLMEYNLISFILLLYFMKSLDTKMDSLNQVIFYFMIQSSASILFLCNFSMGEWLGIFNHDIMFISSMIVKIGLFPLFFWIFKMIESLSLFPLIFLLTTQKIPLLFGLYSSNSSFLMLVLFSSFILGSILLFFSPNLVIMFLCSSISYSFLLFFLLMSSIFSFLSFFFMYSVMISFCLFIYTSSSQDKDSLIFSIGCYMFFLGLPPLGLFFYKFIFAGVALHLLGPMELLLFWFFSFISLMGYIKFFYFSFSYSSSFYSSNSLWLKNIPFLFFTFVALSSLLL